LEIINWLETNKDILTIIVELLTIGAAAISLLRLFWTSSQKIKKVNQSNQESSEKKDLSSDSLLLTPTKTLLNTIFDLGIEKDSDIEKKVSIRTVNIIVFAAMFLSFFWVVLSLFQDTLIVLTVVNGLVFMGFLLVLILQSNAFYKVARNLFIFILCSYYIIVCVITGAQSGVEYFAAGLIVIPVLLFTRQERISMFIAVFIIILSVLVASFTQNKIGKIIEVDGESIKELGTYKAKIKLHKEVDEFFHFMAYYINVILLSLITFSMIFFYNNFAVKNFKDLENEKIKSDELVSRVLPAKLISRIMSKKDIVVDVHGEATILFATIDGFSGLYKRVSGVQLVEILNNIFASFDELVEKYQLEKINMIGSNYIVGSGVVEETNLNHENIARFAIEMVKIIQQASETYNHTFTLRCGICTGPVISGIIGSTKPTFDIWGETVALAESMQDSALANTIVLSESSYWRIKHKFECAAIDGNEEHYLLVRET